MRRPIKGLIAWVAKALKYIRYGRKFRRFDWSATIDTPLRLSHPENIVVEQDASIHKMCWLACTPLTGCAQCNLVIGQGATIGDFAHIYATSEIVIGRNVLLANFVYISDNVHGYQDTNTAVIHQPVVQKKSVHIGEGSWLGEHVCIIGASIGRNCVVGANSVVTRDIPDYCVVVGAPARIIKRYDAVAGLWRQTSPDGAFL